MTPTPMTHVTLTLRPAYADDTDTYDTYETYVSHIATGALSTLAPPQTFDFDTYNT